MRSHATHPDRGVPCYLEAEHNVHLGKFTLAGGLEVILVWDARGHLRVLESGNGCPERHPVLETICIRSPDHGGYCEDDLGTVWKATPIPADSPGAHRSDNTAAHDFAAAGFGAKGDARLVYDVIDSLPEGEVVDHRYLARRLFGEGPWDPRTASRVNKLHTHTLGLARSGVIRRCKSCGPGGRVGVSRLVAA